MCAFKNACKRASFCMTPADQRQPAYMRLLDHAARCLQANWLRSCVSAIDDIMMAAEAQILCSFPLPLTGRPPRADLCNRHNQRKWQAPGLAAGASGPAGGAAFNADQGWRRAARHLANAATL